MAKGQPDPTLPEPGEMVPGAAKPASVRVKIRALSKLKAATVG